MNASQSDSRSKVLAEINLFVNGDAKALARPWTVRNLLEVLEMADRRVAVAVNRDVVVRSRYAEAALADGDRIEILEAVGGG